MTIKCHFYIYIVLENVQSLSFNVVTNVKSYFYPVPNLFMQRYAKLREHK